MLRIDQCTQLQFQYVTGSKRPLTSSDTNWENVVITGLGTLYLSHINPLPPSFQACSPHYTILPFAPLNLQKSEVGGKKKKRNGRVKELGKRKEKKGNWVGEEKEETELSEDEGKWEHGRGTRRGNRKDGAEEKRLGNINQPASVLSPTAFIPKHSGY